MGWIVPQKFFYKDFFAIKYPMKIDMPLKKKPKQIKPPSPQHTACDTRSNF